MAVFRTLGRWRDIEFKPNNSNILYAAKQSGGSSTIYRTNDGGANWNQIVNGLTGSRYRPLIAVTPANPEVIYALFSESDYSFHGLYKSVDSGDNWTQQSNSPNIFGTILIFQDTIFIVSFSIAFNSIGHIKNRHIMYEKIIFLVCNAI